MATACQIKEQSVNPQRDEPGEGLKDVDCALHVNFRTIGGNGMSTLEHSLGEGGSQPCEGLKDVDLAPVGARDLPRPDPHVPAAPVIMSVSTSLLLLYYSRAQS